MTDYKWGAAGTEAAKTRATYARDITDFVDLAGNLLNMLLKLRFNIFNSRTANESSGYREWSQNQPN